MNESYIAHPIKELSSLSKADIQSVITNFLEVVHNAL